MRPRLTYANVISSIALLLVITGGTALATHPGGADTISSADIIDNTVRTDDIRDANLRTADIDTNAITSGKIADGEVRTADVLNDGLTGADIDESSLDSASLGFECPAGYGLAGKDVCYGGAQSNENFNTALSTCAGNGDRLPTLAEGWAVITGLPNPPQFGLEQTWTADQSSGTTQASTLTKNFQGTIIRDSVATTTSYPFRCVTSPHG